MYRLDKETPLTIDIILRLIQRHYQNDLPRLEKLKKYYFDDNKIKTRIQADSTKPNNRVANPYARYITDTLTGYFMGEPIAYNSEDEKILETISDILEYNDESDENMELAKSASIYGIAFERLYMDEEGKLRFTILPTTECIPVYDTTLECNLLYLIRYYKDEDLTNNTIFYRVEVLTEDEVYEYKMNEAFSSLQQTDVTRHFFQMVPVAIYKNNEEEIGDFEQVIDLIDAYDKMCSDGLNDFEYFADAYLALYGFTADANDAKKMKQDRILLMDEGTKAEWIIKNGDSAGAENDKTRIDADIHKFSFCPNMSDENFASNASGVAIKFKTMGMENLVSIKERKFKKGLQQRFEIMSMIAGLLSAGFDFRDIDIIFTRNLPSNTLELAQMVSTLEGIVSKETLLAQLPFVDDVDGEVERVDKEKEDNPLFQSMESYSMLRAQQEPNENEEEEK